MLTDCLYFTSPDLTIDVVIMDSGSDDKGAYIICDRTIFHAQGGGQKSDQGTIDGITVTNVTKRGTPQEFSVVHYLAAPLSKAVGDMVSMQVDGAVRNIHSRLHSLGHLLAHIVDDAYPILKAVQGHHWPGECRVEFDVANDANLQLDEAHINDLLARAIAADLPIISKLSAANGRTVQVAHHAPVPCGGTHLTSTAPLVSGITRGIKIKGSRARISYE